MNILIVSQYFWPEGFRINELALELSKKGHRLEILTGMPNYPSGKLFKGYRMFNPLKEFYHGITVRRVPLIPRFKGRGWNLLLNYISFAISASIIGPMRCRSDYDIIFVYEPSPITVGIPALVLKMITRTPVIFWVQDLWPESLSATGAVKSKWILNMVGRLVRFIYAKSDLILIQSRAFKKSILSFGINEEKIDYFPNSAEELYQPLKLENNASECKQMPDGFKLMFAGNIGEAQDFPTILKAAEYLKDYSDIHWIIIGDGRKFSWVQSRVREIKLSNTVHLLGRYPVENMPRFYSLADVMIVTLKNMPIFSLTIPAKIQSYLACAKPVIAALNGEGANVIKEANAGKACGAENPKALAELVLEMYHMDENERVQLGNNGREYFKTHFKKDILIKRLNDIMQSLSGKG